MSDISAASKIAIMFIRPFRSYLDGYNLINKIKPEIEKNLNTRLDVILEQLGNFPYHKESKKSVEFEFKYNTTDLKDFFYKITMRILDNYEKSYENILPKFIDSLTLEIEDELKKTFTQKELEELLPLLHNPLVVKLLENKIFFGLLKRIELQMDFELQIKFLENISNYKKDTKIQDLLNDYQNKFYNQTYDYGSDFDDTEFNDDDDQSNEK